MAQFSVGERLEAQDYLGLWYPAKLTHVDHSKRTVTVHFERWNKRFDEELSFDSPRLRQHGAISPEALTETKVFSLAGGETVAACLDSRGERVFSLAHVLARREGPPLEFLIRTSHHEDIWLPPSSLLSGRQARAALAASLALAPEAQPPRLLASPPSVVVTPVRKRRGDEPGPTSTPPPPSSDRRRRRAHTDPAPEAPAPEGELVDVVVVSRPSVPAALARAPAALARASRGAGRGSRGALRTRAARRAQSSSPGLGSVDSLVDPVPAPSFNGTPALAAEDTPSPPTARAPRARTADHTTTEPVHVLPASDEHGQEEASPSPTAAPHHSATATTETAVATEAHAAHAATGSSAGVARSTVETRAEVGAGEGGATVGGASATVVGAGARAAGDGHGRDEAAVVVVGDGQALKLKIRLSLPSVLSTPSPSPAADHRIRPRAASSPRAAPISGLRAARRARSTEHLPWPHSHPGPASTHVRCLCGSNVDGATVACRICGFFLHAACVGLAASSDFICPLCKATRTSMRAGLPWLGAGSATSLAREAQIGPAGTLAGMHVDVASLRRVARATQLQLRQHTAERGGGAGAESLTRSPSSALPPPAMVHECALALRADVNLLARDAMAADAAGLWQRYNSRQPVLSSQ